MPKFLSLLLFSLMGCNAFCQAGLGDKEVCLCRQGDSLKGTAPQQVKKGRLLKSFIVPVSLVTSGVLVEILPAGTVFSKERIQQHIQDKRDGFSTKADNYLQFVPLSVLFGLSVTGVPGKSDLLNQAIITAKSELLMTLVVSSMKYFIHDTRPDGSTDNSMPSGHTAQAFVSAALLDMEYHDTSPWISAGGYLCAAATGYLRMANNRHWASDVLVGAGIGIASVKTVYLTHRYRWGRKPAGWLVPVLLPQGGGVAFAMKF